MESTSDEKTTALKCSTYKDMEPYIEECDKFCKSVGEGILQENQVSSTISQWQRYGLLVVGRRVACMANKVTLINPKGLAMIHISSKSGETNEYGLKKKHLKFLSNLFKWKKTEDTRTDETVFTNMDVTNDCAGGSGIARMASALTVSDIVVIPSPVSPMRPRDLCSDMEALRISRQDNPFLQQVLASRESLADSLEESESDHTNLMAQELSNELDTDPLTLPEVHEHMIRSPPPISWPRSPNFKMFRFPDQEAHSSQESLGRKSPLRTVSTSPRHGDFASIDESSRALSPRFSLPSRPHQRSNSETKDRSFSLLTPAPLRSLSEVRRLHHRSEEDSQHLVAMETPLPNST